MLVVEDEALIALELAATIEAAGYAVAGPVSRVPEACDKIDAGLCDAAVIDMLLHGQTAAPIAAKLRAAGIPFIIASGMAYEPEIHEGAFAVLDKPYDVGELERTLRRMLGPTET